MRTAALCLLIGMMIGPLGSQASDPAISLVPGTSLGIVPSGGAAGGDALYLNGGDIIGPRNLQGGGPGGTNFDIGAGSTENPGDLILNYDIGRCTVIMDGHKHRLARFCGSGITFWRKPRIRP